MSTFQYLAYGAAIFVGTLACWRAFLWYLPKKLRAENKKQRGELLKIAAHKAEIQKKEMIERALQRQVLYNEDLEAQIKERTENLHMTDADLDERERYIEVEETRLKAAEKELEAQRNKVNNLKSQHGQYAGQMSELREQLKANLESISGVNAQQVRGSLRQNLIETRTLESQKLVKILQDDLNLNSRRLAQRMLARTFSRYQPEFAWPKALNFVELPDSKLVEVLAEGEGAEMLQAMREIAGIEIEVLVSQNGFLPIIKLAGGGGMYREATRLAMTELFSKGAPVWNRCRSLYDKHRQAIEAQAAVLGRKAVEQLRLNGVHPEIQKLIGSLNWRTSYRQNQYLHTVEVAELAGILATEVGVDPDQAKRAGVLHDIGKSLDYKIEGSHAVISGDYADRFGEARVVCDAVMSHHNDLVMEAPLSYVLKAADTLSGARPGARVNLEEGYQDRLSGIDDVVRSFPGVVKSAIMNGGREVHIEVNHKKITEADLQSLSTAIAKKIEQDVAFPGQIKVLVSRRFEATAVA